MIQATQSERWSGARPGMRRARRGRRRGSPVLALVLVGAVVAGLSSPAWPANEVSWARLGGGAALVERDLAEGTMVAVVWASWSPRCRDLDARLATVRQVVRDQVGPAGRVIAVNFEETAEAAAGFVRGRDLGVPSFLDPEGSFARRYRVSTLPGLVVLRGGQVVYRGKLPDDLAGSLPAILNGQVPDGG